jgi:sphingomyelin phosphodiesterase acid-like 3
MDWKRRMGRVGIGLAWGGSLICLGSTAGVWAQGHADAETVAAVMVSDIHFEPFFDPAKAVELATAPVSAWKKILAGAASPDRKARFAALEKSCPVRGEDASYPLFEASLAAMHTDGAGAKFVTLSGDLISHSFQCKFGAVFPQAAAGAYRAFVEKTIDFVIDELDTAADGVPVYVALGNNDSDCGDYQLDAHSEFLSAVGEQVAKSFPEAERKGIVESYAAGGYFSARLPVGNARMLVLDDQFMGAKYTTCGGKPDPMAAEAQLGWLEKQLAQARQNKEKVWVMAHIPPGVDAHATALKMGETCGAKGPKMFLSSEKIANVLTGNSDVVALAVFAHTHMDELRVLKPENGAAAGGDVAVKMVASVSPINGNMPSITVGRVSASSAALVDYKVIVASNATGEDTTWHEEYDWGKTYHAAEFSTANLSKLVDGFAADGDAKTEASQAYIRDFIAGKDSALLALVWPLYACGLGHDSAQAFKACVCQTQK